VFVYILGDLWTTFWAIFGSENIWSPWQRCTFGDVTKWNFDDISVDSKKAGLPDFIGTTHQNGKNYSN
jgi:hypothetical protein